MDSHLIMPLIIAFKGSQLLEMPESQRKIIKKGCGKILHLQSLKARIIAHTENHMTRIAPNLTKLIGSSVTAKIISKTGGLKKLAEIPSCNIQMIGHERKNLAGLSKHGKTIYVGFLGECQVVLDTLEDSRMKLIKLLSNAAAKASRVDHAGAQTNGAYGEKLLRKVKKDLEKYLEPKHGQEKQPLTVPDEKPKRRRGGKKYRKIKERMGLTDTRQLKNRLKFGTDFSQDVDLNGNEDRGMLGQKYAGGKLRVSKKIQKMKLTQKQKKMQRMKMNKASGTMSSLVFSSNQSIQLMNPELLANQFKAQDSEAQPEFNKPGKNKKNVFGNLGFKTVFNQKNNLL